MKYSLQLLNIFALEIIITAAINDPYKLTAVTDEGIAQALYQRIRNEVTHIEEPPALHPNIKNEICHHITGSIYFSDVMDYKRVHMHKIYQKLRSSRPTLFDQLYKSSDTFNGVKAFTNPTKQIDVYIHGRNQNAYTEYVFICVTLSVENGEESIVDYLVSKEYNLSDTPNPYIPGRFLFRSDRNVHMVAEQPARSLSTPGAEVERLYWQKRQGYQLAETADEDPICSLSHRERLRVCTLVMSSTYFEGDVKLIPDYTQVDPVACVRMEISFQDNHTRTAFSDRLIEEWMISCRPDDYYASYQNEYFLSRVHNSTNEVFVYRWAEDSTLLILENLFGDVRFRI